MKPTFERDVSTFQSGFWPQITDWSSEKGSFGYAVSLLAWHSVGLAIGNSLAGTLFQQAHHIESFQEPI